MAPFLSSFSLPSFFSKYCEFGKIIGLKNVSVDKRVSLLCFFLWSCFAQTFPHYFAVIIFLMESRQTTFAIDSFLIMATVFVIRLISLSSHRKMNGAGVLTLFASNALKILINEHGSHAIRTWIKHFEQTNLADRSLDF